jgi:hypothetical protein
MSENRDREDPSSLGTETKVFLEPPAPEKAIASRVSGYTLVLLTRGSRPDRLGRALERILCEFERPLTGLLDGSCPAVVRRALTLDEAIAAQFELICCDCVSIFLRDEIVAQSDPGYLGELYSQLRYSPEFQPVFVGISFIPATDAGKRFCDQFFPPDETKTIRYGAEIALTHRVSRKKGRMMAHWAKETGVRLILEQPVSREEGWPWDKG